MDRESRRGARHDRAAPASPCRSNTGSRTTNRNRAAAGDTLRLVAEVPFSDDAGRVADLLQRLGQGDLGGRQTVVRVLEEHPLAPAEHPAPQVYAPGQQGRPARRADRGLRVEAGPALALGGHAVEVGRADRRVPVGAEVAVAEVVGEDDDDVGRWALRGEPLGRTERRGGNPRRGPERRQAARREGTRAPRPPLRDRATMPSRRYRRGVTAWHTGHPRCQAGARERRREPPSAP